MAVAPASPPRPPVARGRHTALRGHAIPLPNELVIAILQWLAPDELWGPAHVSRQFYRAAWAAGLIINRTLVFSENSPYASQLALFDQISSHAQKNALRLSLSFELRDFATFELQGCPGLYDGFIPALDMAMPVVTAALSVLVHLSVSIPDQLLPQLYRDLSRHPAPVLRTLAIARTGGPDDSPLPLDLFAKHAPVLRSLSLSDATLPDEPVLALRAVSHVRVAHDRTFPSFAFNLHFPHLTSLALEYDPRFGHERRVTSRLDLRGVSLHKLVVRDSRSYGLLDVVDGSVDLSTIAHLGIRGEMARSARAVTSPRTTFAMRLDSGPYGGAGTTVTIAPSDPGCWKRRLLVDPRYHPGTSSGLAELPGIGTHMAYLRLEAEFIPDFLALGLTLSALRDLHVDALCDPLTLHLPNYVTYPSAHSFLGDSTDAPRVWAPCPALCSIRLFALRGPIPGADSRSVAFLAHALGQLERPEGERTELVLVGIGFAEPVARELLGQVVSNTLLCAFAGRGSRDDHDDGLWEHPVSDVHDL